MLATDTHIIPDIIPDVIASSPDPTQPSPPAPPTRPLPDLPDEPIPMPMPIDPPMPSPGDPVQATSSRLPASFLVAAARVAVTG